MPCKDLTNPRLSNSGLRSDPSGKQWAAWGRLREQDIVRIKDMAQQG